MIRPSKGNKRSRKAAKKQKHNDEKKDILSDLEDYQSQSINGSAGTHVNSTYIITHLSVAPNNVAEPLQ
jgi:hypothetical protein